MAHHGHQFNFQNNHWHGKPKYIFLQDFVGFVIIHSATTLLVEGEVPILKENGELLCIPTLLYNFVQYIFENELAKLSVIIGSITLLKNYTTQKFPANMGYIFIDKHWLYDQAMFNSLHGSL